MTENVAQPGSQNIQGAQGFPTLDTTKCRAHSTLE